jgi:hypothetical protein
MMEYWPPARRATHSRAYASERMLARPGATYLTVTVNQ